MADITKEVAKLKATNYGGEVCESTASALEKTNSEISLLKKLVIAKGDYKSNYKAIQSIVQAGMAKDFFNIGDQIMTTWNDGENDYEMPWDIVHFADVEKEDGSIVPGMYLQSHYAVPGPSFNGSEAFYVVPEEGLQAGTYNIAIAGMAGNQALNNHTFYFTISNNYQTGTQLCFRYSDLSVVLPSEPTISKIKVVVYSSSEVIPDEIVDFIEGSEGTSLGTLQNQPSSDTIDMNHIMDVFNGSSYYSKSFVRQWLNSHDEEWWHPNNKFDSPDKTRSIKSFLSGLPSDFVSSIGATRIDTFEGMEEPTSVYDRFFIPSLAQEYIGYIAENEYFDYWKLKTFPNSPVNKMSIPTFYIRYKISDVSKKAYHIYRTNNGPWYICMAYQPYVYGVPAVTPVWVTPCCVIC